MHKTIRESREFALEIKKNLSDVSKVNIAIFPPFTALKAVYEVVKDSNISLGAQNMWHEAEGAYTGEVSPVFLTDIGCRYVIIGHSERRQYYGETDELVNKKIKAALNWGLIPIVCVGETLEQRGQERTEEVIQREFAGGFKDVDEVTNIAIAYEPIWAIGTGKTATPETAEKAQKFIRNLIRDKYGTTIASDFLILYGGSVKPDNIDGLIAQPDIDGALVGGASLDAESFIKIVKATESYSSDK